MRIVWVEDSDVLTQTLTIYCEKYRAEVVRISEIDHFCGRFVYELTDDDLVLLDILFDNKEGKRDTEGQGYRALHALAAAAESATPVVILTVLGEDEIIPKVVQFPNVQGIVQKPVTPDELEDALNKAWVWKVEQRGK